ncbi:Ribonuclease H domain, partial [Dillenia turbinata]
MNCLSQILSRTTQLFARHSTSLYGISTPCLTRTLDHHRTQQSGFPSLKLGFIINRSRVHCYSSPSNKNKSKTKSKSLSKKSGNTEPVTMMKDEKDAFYVVRKGDVVGVFKSLNDCQAQVGSSVCDPPVSVYKGYSLPKSAEEYLGSRGLKNAAYSIRAADFVDDLFGLLVPCPFQQPTATDQESAMDSLRKRSLEVLAADTNEIVESMSSSTDPARKHYNVDPSLDVQGASSSRSCTLNFDGASKGNPGQAGAGAVLRADDGSLICRLREGLGIATCNVAEYRAMILGLKYALQKGFTNIHVQGDSKLVCMQVQGQWKVKHQNMSDLYAIAKTLRDRMLPVKLGYCQSSKRTVAFHLPRIFYCRALPAGWLQ